jgi:nucleotidyltransferase substrate binding protein (TIGR01987 family)
VERLKERLALAERALILLDELANRHPLSPLERDAAIHRFEYSFESVWKAVQLYLREMEGVPVGSPKQAARASLRTGLLDEEQARQALAMADDRNLTVHTYNEQLANEIAARLPQHAALLRRWVERMNGRVEAR